MPPFKEIDRYSHVGSVDIAGGTSLCEPLKESGTGWAVCHHGELLQGVFAGEHDKRYRALVTLPLSSRGTKASFRHVPVSASGSTVTVFPACKAKARAAAELALQVCIREGAAAASQCGYLDLVSDVPVGLGMGSSTSDVVAAIKAVTAYYRVRLAADEIARLAVLAERASDSIMIEDRVVLFAHREGRVLEVLGYKLPPLVVVGCVNQTAPVDTLEFSPAEYDEREVATFQVLSAAMRRAVSTGDVGLLGRVATASARINQRFLPKPELDFLIKLSSRVGAAGVQVAHSGTVAGLLFDVRRPDLAARIDQCRTEMAGEGLAQGDTFHVPAKRTFA
jgi:uncharacterized protein involved in propanediol utilization